MNLVGLHPFLVTERHYSPAITAICTIAMDAVLEAEEDLVSFLSWSSERDLPKVDMNLIGFFMPVLINNKSTMKSRTSSIYCNFLFGKVRAGIRHEECYGCPNVGIENSLECQIAKARDNRRPEKKYKFPSEKKQDARKAMLSAATIELREYNLQYGLPDNGHYLSVLGCDIPGVEIGIRVPVDDEEDYEFFRSTAGGYAIDECYGRVEIDKVDMLKDLMGDKIEFQPKLFSLTEEQ